MKTILVTGAERPLALAVATRLARAGHRILLTAPDLAIARAAAQSIREDNWSVNVDHAVLDLGSLWSIRRFVRALPERSQFDVLVHGPSIPPKAERNLTTNELEGTLAVNAIGPFLLTQQMLPALFRGKRPGRIVFIASRRNLPGTQGNEVKFDVNDPNLEEGYKPERALTNAELARLWIAYELTRRTPRERLTVHTVFPGYVPQNDAPDTNGVQRFLLNTVLPLLPFATRLESAAEHVTSTALTPMLDRTTGRYWAEDGPEEPCKDAQDPQLGKWFWSYAERITKADRRMEVLDDLRQTV